MAARGPARNNDLFRVATEAGQFCDKKVQPSVNFGHRKNRGANGKKKSHSSNDDRDNPQKPSASGYRGDLLRQAGIGTRIQRFGVGAEFDMFAPHCNQDEALLVVGSQFAPAGYGWVFPWGEHRVRVGVGVIHPDDSSNPVELLDSFVSAAKKLDAKLIALAVHATGTEA